MRVTRVLHAGYLFEEAGVRLLFDPIFENPFSGNAHAFPRVSFDRAVLRSELFDAVFISHFHDDHCSLASLDLLDRETPIYIYCLHEELLDMIRALGFARVTALRLGETLTLPPFRITARPALDREIDAIFVVETAEQRVLNVVDAWIDEGEMNELSALAPFDLVLWPFQTMLESDVLAPSRASPASREIPPEWHPQLRALQAKRLVPSACQFRHEEWSWYRQAYFPISYAGFARELANLIPETAVLRLDPGEAFDLTAGEKVPGPRWIKGERGGDYEYAPRPQTTAEISRNFPKAPDLGFFLEQELPRRLAEVGLGHEPYFERPREWRLRLFDHGGRVETHDYLLGERVEKLALATNVGWETEIPKWKLAAALEHGETLSSLYIRINDRLFPNEDEVAAADVLADPLLRVLYGTDLFGYQRAQLRRLTSTR